MNEPVTLHDEWTDRLSEYLDDELAVDEAQALEAHLRGCPGCRATLGQLRAVKARAGSLAQSQPGPQVWRGIAERIGAPGVGLDDGPADELAARRAAKRLRFPWIQAGMAAAAVLVIGIGLGRMSNRPERLPTANVVAPAPGTAMTGDAYRVAVAQHLARTETLLASFRADAAQGHVDAEVAGWAGQMLSTTRLLLDSPAAADPKLRTLLEDLELVLAQIAALPTRSDSVPATNTEVDLARRAVEESQLLPRMRSIAPAGSPVTQGES